MKRLYFVLIYILTTVNITLAQDLNLSQFSFCHDLINPSSYIQCNDVNILALYNKQYTGFAQEPTTQIADVSLMISDYKLGISVINDIVGFDKTQSLKLRVARQFRLSEKWYFSLGLSAGALHKLLESTKMTFEEDDDPLSYHDQSATWFDFDFGAEFQFDKLFIGLSVTHLGKEVNNPNFESPVSHYFGYAQYALNTNNSIDFYPNFLIRLWEGTIYAEGGLTVSFKNKAWLGAGYSINHDMVASAGMRIHKNILLGYAFKTCFNNKIPEPWKTNTHEVFLNFAFNNKTGRIKSVRFID